ncbi:HEPN domain-containing protein [bacterium]|nr:HEPN domain-containing protein [Mariniblastus sp.]MDA7861601.1 HEPN domain-containing protein [bacterium]MDB4385725.1 HEPN domain-containing protein [bacterium]MDB4391714.1 HEPN domain-containing protein [bacterium]MDB4461314.1 HEPN domain-containing protein [bacterium]
MPDSPPFGNVEDLKVYWEPNKQRLQRACPQHPLAVRMHRAFSWLAAAECDDQEDKIDEKLIFRWIGINSLFGRWNSFDHEPERDGRALTGFLTVMEECDKDALIKAYLIEQQALVSQICSDPFVNKFFWKALNTEKRFNQRRDQISIQRMYSDQNYCQILQEVFSRIYLVRCQLIHGAATFGSKLNREIVKQCGIVLEGIIFAIIKIITDHAWSENWDDLCYPPVTDSN